MNLLHDENGRVSTARTLLWVWIVFVMLMIAVDVISPTVDLAGHVYSAFVAVILALAGWAGGPRMMQHLAPQISRTAKAITGKGSKPILEDDERGEFKDREPVKWP